MSGIVDGSEDERTPRSEGVLEGGSSLMIGIVDESEDERTPRSEGIV